MAYQVTARKWRPMRFSDMVGQEHIARTLRNAIITDRIAHAYLFVGPRGIGKTTSARIFAKALNCEHPIDGEPCCQCRSCKSIADESNVDIIEIDAATHTQVDKAREICEDVLHLPISSKYKIYIIDEVHMLSKSAWNALLKTIEEPPAHAKFIFATTEVNKVLPTVISRCQRFDLKRIPSDLITKRLSFIAGEENIRISTGALNVIARAADGGMRDAQSLLDQLVSFFGADPANEITEEQALTLFGMTSPGEMIDLIRSILDDDRKNVILNIHRFAQQGKNLESLFEEVLAWLRGIMLSIVLPSPETVLDENPERLTDYKVLAEGRKPNIIQTLMEKLSESSYLLREAINKQVFIETIMLKSMRAAHSIPIESLIVRLNQIRRTGELAGIEKVPTLAAIPVESSVFSAPVPPPPAEKKTADNIEKSVPVQENISAEKFPNTPVTAEENIPVQVQEKNAENIGKEILARVSSPSPSPEPAEKVSPPSPVPSPEPDEKISPPPVEEKVPVNGENQEPEDKKVSEEPPPPAATVEEETEEEQVETAGEKPVDPPEEKIYFDGSASDHPQKIWETLSGIARKEKKSSLAELILLGVPQKIENNELVVAFDQEYGETALTAVCAEIYFLMEKLSTISPFAEFRFLRLAGIRSFTGAMREKALDDLKKAVSHNETVLAVNDLFGGKIIDVLEEAQNEPTT